MKRMSVVMIVMVLMVGVVTPLSAEENIGWQLIKSCRGDIKTYCKGVEPGEGRVLICLHDNSDKLSAKCAEVTEVAYEEAKKMEASMAEIKTNCSADFDKYCKDVKPGKGRILKCIKKNEANISPACMDALNEADLRDECGADFDKYCKDVKPGKGRIRECIKQNEANISKKCKDALKKIESGK